MWARTIAIGDVHGCLYELQELLRFVGYRVSKKDRLVFVGDYIDRGPQPLETVRFIRGLQKTHGNEAVVCLKGNHEHKMISWLTRLGHELVGGRPNEMRRPNPERLLQWLSFSADDRAWLRDLPIVVDLRNGWLAVHAGLEDKPLLSQDPIRMMHVRWVDAVNGEQFNGKADEDDPYGQPPGTQHWAERWAGSSMAAHDVVYGHQVRDLKDPTIHAGRYGCYGIDTGCVFGGRLTALVLETREVFQIQTLKEYAKFGRSKTEEKKP